MKVFIEAYNAQYIIISKCLFSKYSVKNLENEVIADNKVVLYESIPVFLLIQFLYIYGVFDVNANEININKLLPIKVKVIFTFCIDEQINYPFYKNIINVKYKLENNKIFLLFLNPLSKKVKDNRIAIYYMQHPIFSAYSIN